MKSFLLRASAVLALFSIVGCQADTEEDTAATSDELAGFNGADDGDALAGMDDEGAADVDQGDLKGIAAAAGPTASACPTNARLSQGFHGGHDGVDLANARGTPIFATGPGVVAASGPAQGYGQWIRIKHDDGSMTEYGHMFQRDVAVGARVAAGQRIALMGSEGQSSGPHLHLRTYRSAANIGSGKGMNPVEYLKARGIPIPCKPGAAAPAPGPAPAPKPAANTVSVWKQASVHDCPKSSCAVIGQLAANTTPTAVCWSAGESTTSDGYTNDKWVKLEIAPGKTGFVTGIVLRGDETGGVTKQCP
jgi:hypothetical protein